MRVIGPKIAREAGGAFYETLITRKIQSPKKATLWKRTKSVLHELTGRAKNDLMIFPLTSDAAQ